LRLSGRGLLIGLFLLTLPLVTPRIRAADEIEYFAYLRSLVFDRDLEFGNEYRYFYDRDPASLAGFRATFLERREPQTGRHINFAPIGSALLWSPAYLAAHAGVLLARGLGSPAAADGFSKPYEAAACYASALYGLLGLLLLHHALVRFGGFADRLAAGALAALWLGSPLLYYMTLAPAFAHASSLFAVSLVVWLSLRLLARGRSATGEWAVVGLAVGLAGLVREQDALYGVVPAGVLLLEALRTGTPVAGARKALALGVGALLGFLPQLFAYRVLNGRFGPSSLVARKMSYGSPHFLDVLFDPGHGLFAWTPLLLLATLGLLAALLRRRDPVVALLAAALLLQVWINGSVESWTQAGAFGSRRFLSATPAFAWGLALALSWALPRTGRRTCAVVLALFVWWNVSLMVQFGLRLMDRQRLEWPRVAVSQLTEVPPRLGRALYLFFTDRERLVKEGA
jgi:hypothetical protein